MIKRDSHELVVARDELWKALEELNLEIKKAQEAGNARGVKRDENVSRFLSKLIAARNDVHKLYALAYANTLMDTFDRLQPLMAKIKKLGEDSGLIETGPKPTDGAAAAAADESGRFDPPKLWTPGSD